MAIEYQLSKEDYQKFSRFYIKDVHQKKRWPFIICILILILALSGETIIWWRVLLALIFSPAIAYGLFYFIPYLISLIRINKAISTRRSFLEKKKLTIIDEGLLIESESSNDTYSWESIASVQSNDSFVYLILADKKTIPFPQSAFTSYTEAINFLGLIQSKIIKIRGSSTYTVIHTNEKPSYLWGLICLIPVGGAIAGLIFLMNGISKYRDKWFILIGAGGIIYTVIIFLICITPLNNAMRIAFVPHAQMGVNELMKGVEFYKLKHGVYPDSLAQIKENGTIWIDDPVQTDAFNNNSRKTRFNYQKVGEHYFLFSSGVDGIPNTKDDIYPQVAKSDSSKFGLIHK
jgi:hypothetical protein